MKDKVLSVLSAVVSFVKANKKVAIGVLVALLVIILVIVIASNGGKPSKYQEKIKTVTKAIGSESKMKKTFGLFFFSLSSKATEIPVILKELNMISTVILPSLYQFSNTASIKSL